ncbi:MAG: hypothetical protein SangKO_000740 [Sandaracinaceae bacterium]
MVRSPVVTRASRKGPGRSCAIDGVRDTDQMRTTIAWALLLTSLGGCDGGGSTPADAAVAMGDGSAGDATTPRCGDGRTQAGEACDDGNVETGDGCSEGCMVESAPATADQIVEATDETGAGFGDPTRATNGVRGGGQMAQSLDVYSISVGGHLVLGWSGRLLVDGPGVDLVVFENAFDYGDGVTFMDPVVVEVSQDGETWVAFPHDYLAEDETVYSPRAPHWRGFAGVTPVSFHAEERPELDLFDPTEAGGDGFDLADVGLPHARYVRLSSAAAHDNPDTGAAFPRDPVSDGPDIDGVAARWLAEAP